MNAIITDCEHHNNIQELIKTSPVILKALGANIFADNDENGTGQKAANQLAERLISEGRTVRVLFPSIPGVDWLDVLTNKDGK